jgi:hypothetical protein
MRQQQGDRGDETEREAGNTKGATGLPATRKKGNKK